MTMARAHDHVARSRVDHRSGSVPLREWQSAALVHEDQGRALSFTVGKVGRNRWASVRNTKAASDWATGGNDLTCIEDTTWATVLVTDAPPTSGQWTRSWSWTT
jgi:hypothetical protein